jgi:hypothetical protein
VGKDLVVNIISIFSKQLAETVPDKKVILDEKLLADVLNELPAGTVFNEIKKVLFNEDYMSDGLKASYAFEENKILLLYMQAHRLATCYPEETVHFYFYDDRITESRPIGPAISSIFEKHPEFLPSNLVLTLSQYNGQSHIQEINSYRGTGSINYHHDKFYLLVLLKHYKPYSRSTEAISSAKDFLNSQVVKFSPKKGYVHVDAALLVNCLNGFDLGQKPISDLLTGIQVVDTNFLIAPTDRTALLA